MPRIAQIIWTFIRHNPYLVYAIVVCILLLLWAFGCQPTAKSPLDPSRRVTRSELQIEIDLFLRKAEIADAELTQKEQIVSLLVKQAFLLTDGGSINFLSLATSIGTILGIGSIADNRRKDKVISKTKSKVIKSLSSTNNNLSNTGPGN